MSLPRIWFLWADLAGTDAARVHNALWELVLQPAQALPLRALAVLERIGTTEARLLDRLAKEPPRRV